MYLWSNIPRFVVERLRSDRRKLQRWEFMLVEGALECVAYELKARRQISAKWSLVKSWRRGARVAESKDCDPGCVPCGLLTQAAVRVELFGWVNDLVIRGPMGRVLSRRQPKAATSRLVSSAASVRGRFSAYDRATRSPVAS